MAQNPYDFMAPLLQRYRTTASNIGGEDVAYIAKDQWNSLCLHMLLIATVLRMIQKLNPQATDAALAAEFDNALNLSPGQSWDTILNRTFLLGSDPATNPWLPHPQ